MSPRGTYIPSRLSPAFLETQILDDCVGGGIPDYLAMLPRGKELVTWHGCVRECKLGILPAARRLEESLRKNGVRILLPEEIFGEASNVAAARHLIDESSLPNEDAWAVAVAMVTNCALFVTRDAGIHTAAPSLGLNHPTAFVRAEQIATLVAEADS